MASNSTDNTVSIDRSYIDGGAVKEFVKDKLVPSFFPDIDVSLRTVGMVGMTSELVSNIAEDGFNMASVLYRETFPNRAELPESIYSHASIFQLANSFASASICSFLMVLEEEAIINGGEYDKDSGFYYFYIDKNTTVYIEDTPYVLDYPIQIKYVVKRTEKGLDYIFTSQYIIDSTFKNSISSIIDPYIKIRRSNNGYLALEVSMHQCQRVEVYESIITNAAINMPVVDVRYDGILAGFDVFYKTPEEDNYTTQMTKLLVYSQPITTPFCYYQKYDDNVVRLTFNSNDTYFMPEFNSELKIVLYITEGEKANFDVYNGNEITIVPDTSEHDYDFTFIMGAKPLSASVGGKDEPSIEELQALTVEAYRTANALTTDADLAQFFNNYQYRYGNAWVRFIKRRNDVYERIFGSYIVMKRDEYIFKTNTLNINMNLSDMTNSENNIYIIEPGTLFVYESDESNSLTFYRDQEKFSRYYQEYLEAVENGTIPYITENVDVSEIPDYLNRPASFAEFKKRKGYDDKLRVFDLDEETLTGIDDPATDKFLFMNPFMIRFKKNPNLVSMYMTFINQKSTLDFTNQNTDSYVQFVLYQAQIERYFTKKKEYTISTVLMPSVTVDSKYPVIAKETDDPNLSDYVLNDRFAVANNDLRVIFVIYDAARAVCFTELWPTKYENGDIAYTGKFTTGDYITSDGMLRLCDDTIYRDPDDGSYYEVKDDDATEYLYYTADGSPILDEDGKQIEIPVDDITDYVNRGLLHKYSSLINMTGNDHIQIPMENVTCKIFTLYRRIYDTVSAGLIPTTSDQTNNPFVVYTPRNDKQMIIDPYHDYDTYIWTNEYSSASDPFTFVKPLNNCRANLYFEDYAKIDPEDGSFIHDIMDVRMESIPFVRWNLAYDEENLTYFMNAFSAQYEAIKNIIFERLRNETVIDVKLYNTYGRSKNYYIGDTTEILNRLNLKIAMDVWFVSGTDVLAAVPEVQRFIKSEIETLNDSGTNRLHVSNLLRKLELAYAYIDHIRFISINGYDSSYQSIILQYQDLDDMTKEERRAYIPEMLVVDMDDIIINDYIVD
jgi:hypothetical protein